MPALAMEAKPTTLRRRRMHRGAAGSLLATAILCALALGSAAPGVLHAQSVLDRTPNFSGAWVGQPGTVYFNFVHRFDLVDTDGNDADDKVVNTPSFLLAAPLPGRTLLGLHYGSNSQVVPGKFNEVELFARWAPLSRQAGHALDAGFTVAYNGTAESVDGEVSLGLPLGRVTLLGVGRVLSDAFGSGEARWGGGAGLSVRLSDNVALAGDIVALADGSPGEHRAWGVALQARVPLTPHSFSIHASNTRTATLQGSSRGMVAGGDKKTFYGFEFTIPFTLSRYFRGGGGHSEAAPPTSPATGGTVEVTMTNQLRYSPGTVRIPAGGTVRWRNATPLIHTVTADPDLAMDPGNVLLPGGAQPFDSGEMQPGDVFEHTFTVPGEYRYVCIPHEAAMMVGTVIVEG